MNDFFLDGAVFGSGPPDSVRRDAAGVPIAWRLLKAGKLSLVKNGVADALDITKERLTQAIDYFTCKGEKVPIDSSHYLSALADQHKIPESEVERLIPGGAAAMGYGQLALSADGSELWIDKIQWKDPAYKLLKDGIYKYFSPMLRGLKEGPFRVTCVALENQPAINDLDELAAQAADDTNPIRLAARGRIEEKKKGNPMDPTLLKALQKLVPGCDVLALAAEDPAKSKPEQNKIACAVEDTAVMLTQLRDLLKLPADADRAAIEAALKGVLAKAGSADTTQQENLAMKASAEKTEKARLIADGKQNGQITDAMLAWADTQDSKALSAYLQHAPKLVPTGQLPKPERKPTDGDTVALTAEEKRICQMAHVSEENYLKEKKGGNK